MASPKHDERHTGVSCFGHTMLLKIGLQPGNEVPFVTFGLQSPGLALLPELRQLKESRKLMDHSWFMLYVPHTHKTQATV